MSFPHTQSVMAGVRAAGQALARLGDAVPEAAIHAAACQAGVVLLGQYESLARTLEGQAGATGLLTQQADEAREALRLAEARHADELTALRAERDAERARADSYAAHPDVVAARRLALAQRKAAIEAELAAL